MPKAILAALIGLLMMLPAASRAQQQPSVAEAARKAREQKKNEPKAGKVFTNDNLPEAGTISVVGTAPLPSKGAQAATKEGSKELTPDEKRKQEEAKWQQRFAEARSKLQQAQKELDILQRELQQLQVQYYSDPNKALMQQYSRGDIDEQRKKIADKQKEVAQLRQALSDLEDELRKSGGNPGLARE